MQAKLISCLIGAFLTAGILHATDSLAAFPANVKALYLPSHCFTERKISEFIHYSRLAGINAAVLHVKDPHGWIRWKSDNALAAEIGAVAAHGRVESVLKTLKAKGFWTIAKLDLFVDHRLVTQQPEMGILDIRTDGPWLDKNGLAWANPYNQTVWEYNIALACELAALGFDEIQFDYVRFPSDGDLTSTYYPSRPEHLTKTRCIGNFLEFAYGSLQPLGVTISVDLFGLVAWKTEDFGVGQLIESIAPTWMSSAPCSTHPIFRRDFWAGSSPEIIPLKLWRPASSASRNARTK
jgi:hypothetical protein